MTTRPCVCLFITITLLAAGCGGSGEDPTAPPQGWQSSGERWWRPDADTARAYRDMSSLKTMGVISGDKVYSVSAGNVSAEQLATALKERIQPLYRNHPRIIDSLFQAHVRPMVEDQLAGRGIGGSLSKAVDKLKQKAVKAIRNNFREPTPTTTPGEDAPIIYPDSLQQQGVSGEVQTQVYLNKKGEPQAIRLLNGLGHPVMDQGMMRTTAESKWRPAYVLRNGSWQPVPSWIRYSLNFTPAG
jgi:hypothetical protein